MESFVQALESERSRFLSTSYFCDEDCDKNATKNLFKQADALEVQPAVSSEIPVVQSISAAELAENRILELEEKVKLLEGRLDEWGKRCDEADKVEEQLRFQLYENSETWKQEKLSLMQKFECLNEETERLKGDLIKLQGMYKEEKLELENLRSAKRMWLKEKKEKNEEISMLTSRILALRKELRRIAGKNSGDLSPSSSVLLSMECYGGSPENAVTPTRKVSEEQKPPITSKKKSAKSVRSFRSELPCEPFSIDD